VTVAAGVPSYTRFAPVALTSSGRGVISARAVALVEAS
jgi:hypothetical protein